MEDFDSADFATSGLTADVVIASVKNSCCQLLEESENCPCSTASKPKKFIVEKAAKYVGSVVQDMIPQSYSCSQSAATNETREVSDLYVEWLRRGFCKDEQWLFSSTGKRLQLQ